MSVLVRTLDGTESEISLLDGSETVAAFKLRVASHLSVRKHIIDADIITLLLDGGVLADDSDLTAGGVLPGAEITVLVDTIGMGDGVVYQGEETRISGRVLSPGERGTVLEIREAHAGGRELRVKMASAGARWFAAERFKVYKARQGTEMHLKEMLKAGVSVSELRSQGYENTREFLEAGFQAEDIKRSVHKGKKDLDAKKFKADGADLSRILQKSLVAINGILSWSPSPFELGDLRKAGYTCADFKKAGASAQVCRQEGFSALECREAGYSEPECRECQ
eukprot:TRINITY_DN49246_c0_g1_i1.p1 TRINITY_DN49246_c0_g1~~TRINITY_DN49246_c0_g1_i1.p1  ORF type:complete len:280 (-),score=35.76 TRINITY_DN49246_c0_g1_i1:74-913(-)